MTIQRRVLYISRLAVAVTAFSVLLPIAAHAQPSSPIHDVDNGARQPVQFRVTMPANENNPIDAYTVPTGKRLVIETITANLTGPSILSMGLFDPDGITGVEHFLQQGPSNGLPVQITTLPERFYANPGTMVQFRVVGGGGFITVSGYLVNLP